jgi:multidrug efflux system membrane fusion protein
VHQDVPIFRIGIGTVQAFNTVLVRARVDGELQQVAFKEGQDVKAGDLLARIDPRPFEAQLRQADAEKARDEALLANAKRDLTRFDTLGKNGFASGQSVDTQKSLVAQFQAAVARDEALIENARLQLEYTRILSPLDGRTGLRLVDQGNLVHANDSKGLVSITQLQPIAVIFTLPARLLPAINRAGDAGPLVVEAWNEDDSEKLDSGTLALVDNLIDQATGTLKLKATFPNQAKRLWPGQFANAHLLIETRHDATTVPTRSVQRGPAGPYVWFVKPDQSVEMRPIVLRDVVGDLALVDKGLAEGDPIVIDGQSKLTAKTKKVMPTLFRRQVAATPDAAAGAAQ